MPTRLPKECHTLLTPSCQMAHICLHISMLSSSVLTEVGWILTVSAWQWSPVTPYSYVYKRRWYSPVMLCKCECLIRDQISYGTHSACSSIQARPGCTLINIHLAVVTLIPRLAYARIWVDTILVWVWMEMHVRVHVHVGVWVCGVCVWMCVCVISDQIMGQGLVYSYHVVGDNCRVGRLYM